MNKVNKVRERMMKNELPPALAGGPRIYILKGFSLKLLIVLYLMIYTISAKAFRITPFPPGQRLKPMAIQGLFIKACTNPIFAPAHLPVLL